VSRLVAHAACVLVSASRQNDLFCNAVNFRPAEIHENCAMARTPSPDTRDACATRRHIAKRAHEYP
jgi:hypothetical protein